jgi:hypothetical protein
MSGLTWDRSKVIAAGFVPTGDTTTTMPGLWYLTSVAKRLDVSVAGIAAFRLSDTLWEVFKRPDCKPGYKSEAMLP